MSNPDVDKWFTKNSKIHV